MIFMGSRLVSKESSNHEETSGISQKAMLKNLSTQEKLLLVELHRTRQNIIEELKRVELEAPPVGIPGIEETIKDYERKLFVELNPASALPQVLRGDLNKSSSVKTGRLNVGSREKSVIKSTPKTNTFKTGIDMLPVLDTYGGAKDNKFRTVSLKLPVFRLPKITPKAASREANEDELFEERMRQRDAMHTATEKDARIRFLMQLQKLSRADKQMIQHYLGISEHEFDVLFSHYLNTFHGDPDESRLRTAFSIACSEYRDGHLRLGTAPGGGHGHGHGHSHSHAHSSTASLSGDSMTSKGSRSLHSKSLSNLNVGHNSSSALITDGSQHHGHSHSHHNTSRGNHSNKQKSNNGNSMSRGESLRNELIQSLRNVELHSSRLKQGLAAFPDLPSQDGKLKAMRSAIAAESLRKAMWALVKHDLMKGIAAWRRALIQQRVDETRRSFARCLSLRNISSTLFAIAVRILLRRFQQWIRVARHETKRLLREKQSKAATTIQRVHRGRIARRRVEILRQRNKYQHMYDATIKIQAFIRGTLVKWKYRKFRREQLEDRSVRLLQRVVRGHLGRKRVRRLRLQFNKHLAATRIQCMVRCRRARKRVSKLRESRRKHIAAIAIQRIVRGFVVRRTIKSIIANRSKILAAITIQRIIRGCLARIMVKRRRKDIVEYIRKRHYAATRLQAAYRGFRSRLMTKIFMLEKERERRRIFDAATKINTCIRGFISRRRYARLLKDRMTQWMSQARAWREVWSDDAKAFFYLHEATGESIWEPRKDGYTKADGKLVLPNGQIIDDPRFKIRADNGTGDLLGLENEEDEETRINRDKVCAECSERIAIVHCNECGDKFCTKCFKHLHATGTRRGHSTRRLGPIDCSECEERLAERFCLSCDESYCDVCWRKLHSKGKRRYHPFNEVSPFGHIDPHIFTMDGEEVDNFNSTYSTTRHEQSGYEETSANENTGEWQMFYDDDGNAYWYNSETGQSQYESPY